MSSNEKEWPSKAAQAKRHFEASGISLSRRVMKSLIRVSELSTSVRRTCVPAVKNQRHSGS